MKTYINFFINPLLSLFATLLTFLHFLIILLPFYLTLIPLLNYLEKESIYRASENLIFYFLVGMFVLTIIYLLLDMLFGFTIKHFINGTLDVKKEDGLQIHQQIFDEVSKQFSLKNVKYLLKESEEINAYAVASFGRRFVIITTGMIIHIENTFDEIEDRQKALKGLIGHELSHLINWDFLPSLIILSGSNVSAFIEKIFGLVLNIVINTVRFVPIIGTLLSIVMVYSHNILNMALKFTYKFIIQPLFLLEERYLGRLVEYRSDYQSAQALDREHTYCTLFSLLSLDGNTYHSSFSTHPNTISRILNIYKITDSNKKISVSFFSKYFGIILLTGILIFSTYLFFYQNSSLVYYMKEFNILSTEISTILTNFFINIKSYIMNIFNFIKEISLNNILFEVKNLWQIFIITFVVILTFYVVRKILFSIKARNVLKKCNKTENTPLDILLYYAVENNDKYSFIKILQYGANINTNYFEKNLLEFAKETNPKFLKYLK